MIGSKTLRWGGYAGLESAKGKGSKQILEVGSCVPRVDLCKYI